VTSATEIVSTDDAEILNERFRSMAAADLDRFDVPAAAARWLFAERLAARNERSEMSFSAYLGPAHIEKFFGWHRRAEFPDIYGSLIDDLVEASVETDQKVFAHFRLRYDEALVRKVGRYNAQDYAFQRAYAVPGRQAIKTLLDFGAGHGRMANLAFSTPRAGERIKTYVAVDGIASTYLTQRAYFQALGLSVWDYLDHHDPAASRHEVADAIEAALSNHDIVHLTTWCLPLLPTGSIDAVSCVQVLKELPGDLVPWLIPEFSRVVQPAGALYLRDHLQFHNPNHMPIDLLVQAAGFALEFAPMLRDRAEVHGLPRIWRKIDPSLYV
jgi:SAM-dependent methyltransferase